jgi:hypothetical protein
MCRAISSHDPPGTAIPIHNPRQILPTSHGDPLLHPATQADHASDLLLHPAADTHTTGGQPQQGTRLLLN